MSSLKHTSLYDLHVHAGAKMVEFAGYEMPVQYPLGVRKEHLHTRAQAGLFDVSHMGQVKIKGNVQLAAQFLETIVPCDVIGLEPYRQRYGLLTNEVGGILDDLMMANLGDHLFLVVNAACKHADIAHIRRHLPSHLELEFLEDRSLLALQGPMAADVLAQGGLKVNEMIFMDIKPVKLFGFDCIVSRSGYTGEDGFELSIANQDAEALAKVLLADERVQWIGLGARDSLRLESGLCLYGHDIDRGTTPFEANLLWAIQRVRRTGGDREGGFIGDGPILAQIDEQTASRKRIGLIGETKAPVREGTALCNQAGEVIGAVTSGGFGPSVDRPISMGYVATEYSAIDSLIYANVRGKLLPMTVSKMPFVTQNYYRGDL